MGSPDRSERDRHLDTRAVTAPKTRSLTTFSLAAQWCLPRGCSHGPVREPPTGASTRAPVRVSLSPELGSWAASLREALDPDFVVSVGVPAENAELLVVDTDDAVRVTEIRRIHPHTGLVVILTSRRRDNRAIVLYNAGADVVLADPEPQVLAAHLRAVARSYSW